MVTGQPDEVIVPGDYPELVELVPVHRVFVPDPSVVTKGVPYDVRGEHVVADSGYHFTVIQTRYETSR